MQGDREERIRRRAYQIWEREGHPEGRGEAHWAQACAEIDAEDKASIVEKAVDAGAGVVTKVVRRTKKAATQAIGAGLNAVVDVVEEALAPKKTRARKSKDEAGKPDPAKAEAAPAPAAEPAKAAKGGKKSQLPVPETGTRAVAKTEDMDSAEKAMKPARGKAGKSVKPEDDKQPEASAKPRRKSAAGQNTEAAH
ncbi:DUF2934 domain-containing protein [Azospirillum rugosum]|uniref:DUF2934 domain-containing protein n=1 Tax=Azospirillum rugosum TaxID=416170 RepID=A0ABS4SFJ4_9PROT|nr:DUF2934 domain-containing protein [Azospirillum rugosum]MBP2291346.1 hypothetical protein [Azospirillum rugosum]MDQ0525134.1 hypothetical protein [Azospirillum rugosum]